VYILVFRDERGRAQKRVNSIFNISKLELRLSISLRVSMQFHTHDIKSMFTQYTNYFAFAMLLEQYQQSLTKRRDQNVQKCVSAHMG